MCNGSNEYLDNGDCLLCDSSNKYLNNGSCVVCSSNYFVENYSCVECTLSNCLDCSSLSACEECDQNNNYVLNEQTNLCEASVSESMDLLPYQIALIAVGGAIVVGGAAVGGNDRLMI